jgi:hypothetical protein
MRPKPQPGELLSGWIARLALANGLAPRALLRILTGDDTMGGLGARPDMRLDATCPRDVLATLSRDTGIAPGEIAGLSLDAARQSGRPSLLAFLAARRPDWLRPLAVGSDRAAAQAKRRAGLYGDGALAFCPECLRETPWARRWWRFVLARVCLRHGCRLLDRCPRCRRSWAPQRVTRLQPLTACHACGADLARAATQDVTPDEAWRQWAIEHRLLRQIDDARNGSRSVEGAASLDALLRDASRALRTPVGGGTTPMIRFRRRLATPTGARRRTHRRRAAP